MGTIKKVAHIEVERIQKKNDKMAVAPKQNFEGYLFLTTNLSLPRIKVRMETRDRKLEPGDLRQEM